MSQKLILKGVDGQFLAVWTAERPTNQKVVEVFMIFMDFANYPEVWIAFQGRFFGINVCDDPEHYGIMVDWMDLEISELSQKSNVFDPLLNVMLKLYFKHDEFEDAVIVRKKKIICQWESIDTFKGMMAEAISHLDAKGKGYYANVRDNKKKKMKKKYGKKKRKNHKDKEEDTGDEESSNDEESGGVCDYFTFYFCIIFVSQKSQK